jgi:mRNA interferase YafQ
MYQLTTARQFERDYKLCKKRNYKMNLLNELFLALEKTGTVPVKNKPHKLTGNYKGFWECHIQPDWLLIWFQNDSEKIIELTRTGTHSDLF